MATQLYCYMVSEGLSKLTNYDFNWQEVATVAYCLGVSEETYAGDVYFIKLQIRLLNNNEGRDINNFRGYGKGNAEYQNLLVRYFSALNSISNYGEFLIQASVTLEGLYNERHTVDITRIQEWRARLR